MRLTVLPTLFILATVLMHAQTDTTSKSDDDADVFDANEVVVSASRWEEKARTVSREITTMSSRDIVKRDPSTTADALAKTGLIHVQKSQLGGGSPMLRGFAANAVLMVVDGIRINNAIYRGGNLQSVIMIDASALDGLEVLYGPGSVQYGSDALGGVMNFRTRTPFFSDSPDELLYSGNGFVRYGTAATEVSGSVAIDMATKTFASSTVLSMSTFGDLSGGRNFMDAYPDFGKRPWYVTTTRDNNNQIRDTITTNSSDYEQVPTGYDQYNIIQKLRFKLNDESELKYTGIFTTSTRVPRYDRLLQQRDSIPRFAEWHYGPQLWTLHALTYEVDSLSSIADRLSATGSFQFYRETRVDRPFQNTTRRTREEDVIVGALNVDLQKRLWEGGSRELDLYYGVEAYVNDVASSAEGKNVDTDSSFAVTTRYPDGGSFVTSAAAYAQIRAGVSESLTLAGGLRYTWYDLQSTVRGHHGVSFHVGRSWVDNGGDHRIDWCHMDRSRTTCLACECIFGFSCAKRRRHCKDLRHRARGCDHSKCQPWTGVCIHH